MSKLLAANFIRLKKSKLFWIIAVFNIVASCASIINTYDYNQELIDAHAGMTDFAFTPTTAMHLLYNFTPLLGLMVSLMLAIFLGTEYHDNTMRNKLICGQSRSKVYLANLLTCFSITLFFWLLPILMVLILGIPLLGMPALTSAILTQLLVFGMIGLFLCAVYASLCTLIGMLIHNRSYSLSVGIVLAISLLIFGSYCESRLEEPEYYSDYMFSFTEDGTQNISSSELIKNPYYLEGNARRIYTFLYDFLPGGQTIQIANLHVAHPYLLLLYSLGMTGGLTLAGLYFFEKKDLK